ncbi:U6 snRNA phosphodiesterase [Chloropicon primus]|nr:U6 snRNA phosphodiesterase [Chloropicon primus]
MALPTVAELLGPRRGREGTDEGAGDRRKNKRVRNTPHVEGDYSTHVFVDVQHDRGLCEAIEALASDLEKELRERCGVVVQSLGEGSKWHVSLSRTVALRKAQIETYTSLLRRQAKGLKEFACGFGGVVVLRNDEGTTSFVALALEDRGKGEGGGLDGLVNRVDWVHKRHGLREYYQREERLHHLSLLWAPGEDFARLTEGAKQLQAAAGTKAARGLRDVQRRRVLRVKAISAKIGSQITTFSPSPT